LLAGLQLTARGGAAPRVGLDLVIHEDQGLAPPFVPRPRNTFSYYRSVSPLSKGPGQGMRRFRRRKWVTVTVRCSVQRRTKDGKQLGETGEGKIAKGDKVPGNGLSNSCSGLFVRLLRSLRRALPAIEVLGDKARQFASPAHIGPAHDSARIEHHEFRRRVHG